MYTVASRGWKTKHLGGARGTTSSCNGEEAGLVWEMQRPYLEDQLRHQLPRRVRLAADADELAVVVAGLQGASECEAERERRGVGWIGGEVSNRQCEQEKEKE